MISCLNNLSAEEIKSLLNYLQGYLTEQRQDRIKEILKNRTRHINVVLEDLYQPHNASAVMRSADAFGVQDIHIIENRNTFISERRISAGSEKWLTLYRYRGENSSQLCIEKLKSEGYLIAATTPRDVAVDIRELDVNQKISLIFGTELTGLTDIAMDLADVKVRIPMYGFTESYNISVSAALSLYELSTRMREERSDWKLSNDEILRIETEWTIKSVRAGKHLAEKFLSQNE
jgi:tRNA (guanosine-2'-O-)-methyltransferase